MSVVCFGVEEERGRKWLMKVRWTWIGVHHSVFYASSPSLQPAGGRDQFQSRKLNLTIGAETAHPGPSEWISRRTEFGPLDFFGRSGMFSEMRLSQPQKPMLGIPTRHSVVEGWPEGCPETARLGWWKKGGWTWNFKFEVGILTRLLRTSPSFCNGVSDRNGTCMRCGTCCDFGST